MKTENIGQSDLNYKAFRDHKTNACSLALEVYCFNRSPLAHTQTRKIIFKECRWVRIQKLLKCCLIKATNVPR